MSMAASYDEISLPFDDRAESAIINYCQTYPERILDLGLLPDDFYSLKHRRVFQSMVALRLERPEVTDPGEFYLQLAESLAQVRSPRSTLNSVDGAADWIECFCGPQAPSRGIDHFVWQIKRCTEARRIIDAAQQVAERAYRVPKEDFDVTDASVMLSRVAGIPQQQENLGWTLPV